MIDEGSRVSSMAPGDEPIYRRIRLTTVALPAVSVPLLLAFAILVLDPRVSTVVSLVISSGLAFLGVSVFSGQVFAALEPLRGRLVRQNQELLQGSVRLRALYQAGVHITSDLSLSAVLQHVVEASREVVDARYGALAVLDQEGKIADFITSGLSPDQRAAMGDPPRGRGLIGHVISTRAPYRTANMLADPLSSGFPPGHPVMTSFLGVPLVYKGRVIGNLYLTDKGDGSFSQQDEDAIQSFAGQAAVAIENARLYQQVQDVAVLQERERISMDLHDGTIQGLFGLSLKLEDCIGRVDAEPAAVKEDLDSTIESINGIIRDIRSYIFDLRPLRLQGADLVGALAELVEETRVNTMMAVELAVGDPELGDRLSEEQASQLFAIVNEALSNVRKHAQARNVTISLDTENGRLVLRVRDDGRGLAADSRGRFTGRGLENMADRAESLAGSFSLDSAPSQGATVTVKVPLVGPDAARS